MIQTERAVDLEALLAEEIPCGGDGYADDPCDRPAVLMSRCHGDGQKFKCIACWQKWYARVVANMDSHWAGLIRCNECSKIFDSVRSFSDYRPF